MATNSGYAMELGKKYTLTTVGDSIVGESVKVVGIISYSETKKTDYDVRVLAINEKVLSSDESWEVYLNSITFYKCETIGTVNPGRTLIVWSDIVDSKRTNLLDETYNNYCYITIPNTNVGSLTNLDTIKSQIIDFAASRGVSVSFKSIASSDTNTVISDLQDRINEYNKVLRGLQALNVILPTIEKIQSDDITAKLTSIGVELKTISEKVTVISAGL